MAVNTAMQSWPAIFIRSRQQIGDTTAAVDFDNPATGFAATGSGSACPACVAVAVVIEGMVWA